MHPLRHLDPRNSLTVAAVWLAIALSLVFSTVAAYWVGSLASETVLGQHVRQLTLESDELASDLDQALSARLGAIREAARILRPDARPRSVATLRAVFDNLQSMYPEQGWVALADTSGRRVAGHAPATVDDAEWFRGGLQRPWIGSPAPTNHAPAPESAKANASTGTGADAFAAPATGASGSARSFAEFAAPARDSNGDVVAVALGRLQWRWANNYAWRLERSRTAGHGDEVAVLDRTGRVLVGQSGERGRPWPGLPAQSRELSEAVQQTMAAASSATSTAVQALPDGRVLLVSRSPVDASTEERPLAWRVQVAEPRAEADARADSLRLRLALIALGLGALAAVAGGIGAHRLTRRLERLSRAVDAVGDDDSIALAAPNGRDEVSRLGRAFARVLRALQDERAQLRSLTDELEARVASRTAQAQRLAAEAGDAAFVRGRLKLARDLHDTLAHSMMAMLTEVRILRRLQAHDTAALPDELVRAEATAQQGLDEARAAIKQLRFSSVRDIGLGAALREAGQRLADRTGLRVDIASDEVASALRDDGAETLYRIAEEALRNVERHAQASCVTVTATTSANGMSLAVRDDGVGFDVASVASGHYGIVGIRELAHLLGATLAIESSPGRGTSVSVQATEGTLANRRRSE